MWAINRIRNFYWGGIMLEILTFFLLLIFLGPYLFYPISRFMSRFISPESYKYFLTFFPIICFYLIISTNLNTWLLKFGGNVVSKVGRRITGLSGSITIDLTLLAIILQSFGEQSTFMANKLVNWLAATGLWRWELDDIQAGRITFFELFAATFIILFLAFSLRGLARELSGKITQPFRDFFGERKMGIGGSSKFIGLLEEWKYRFKPKSFLIGTSLYEPAWKLGYKDDRHILTIGSPRSGKGRSAIIPNLLTWPYSAIVIDPKGGNSAVTAARRGYGGGRVTQYMGQEVYVIDPFNMNGETSHFNPLSVLDPQSFTITEDIKIISEALERFRFK